VPCRTPYAAATVDALMRWFAVFGVVLLWISDRGSHFKNEVVRRVQKELKANHHFTTENCPWSNGTVESACKQVICAFRAVLSELKMYADEWPEVVNMVQSVLNNCLSTRLNKRTPMQVFTGHAETTSLALMLRDNAPVNAPLDFIKAQKLIEVEKLSKDMTEIRAQGAEKSTRDRKALFRSMTTRRTCGHRTSKWATTCLSRNSARVVCPSCRSSGRARAASRVWSPTTCSS
jgi:hypothetical protein